MGIGGGIHQLPLSVHWHSIFAAALNMQWLISWAIYIVSYIIFGSKCCMCIMWLFNHAKHVITTTWTIPPSLWKLFLLLNAIRSFMTSHLKPEFLMLLCISRLHSRHHPYIKKASGGCPSKLSEQDLCYATQLIGTSKAENAVQVAKALQDSTNQPFSAQTVQNHMKKMGMKAVVKKKRPLLTKCHRREPMIHITKWSLKAPLMSWWSRCCWKTSSGCADCRL